MRETARRALSMINERSGSWLKLYHGLSPSQLPMEVGGDMERKSKSEIEIRIKTERMGAMTVLVEGAGALAKDSALTGAVSGD